MFIYFFFIRIAALFGHKKARAMVRGQRQTWQSDLGSQKGCIWIHAASVGEFEQARPLIEKIKADGKQKVVVTFFSSSGYEARKDYALADGVYYLPFATRRNARKWLEAVEPKMAIFVKYEFWPAYLRALKKRGIPSYSISAIFRPEQHFFRWWGKSQLKLLKNMTHLYVQDEASLQLLQRHGVQNVSVAGDTRFDRMDSVRGNRSHTTDQRLVPMAEFAEGFNRVIIGGSTWPEDEALLVRYVEQQNEWSEQPVKLILVPHEINPQHLHYIFNLLRGRMTTYSAVSQMKDAESRRNILRRADVLVVDTMGLLSATYRYGQVAYVGGGFGEGIHNTVEPAAFGMPVIFGPKYHHFREAEGLIAAGAARSIRRYDELAAALDEAQNQHTEIGTRAADYVQAELGATDKIYKEIF